MNEKNSLLAYAQALLDLAKENPDVVALEAGRGDATMSRLFREAFPERYFDMGSAEANMASTAAGLALAGKMPFIHSYAVLSTGRAYDQLRQAVGLGKLKVRICGAATGFSNYGEGAMYQSVEDISLMRAIPGMTVLSPADANEAAAAVRAMEKIEGPAYIRLCGNPTDVITDENRPFVVGMPYVMKEGSDIVVFATGIMVARALEAARALEGEISVRVVNVPSLKPVNRAAMIESAKGCVGVVSAEEGNLVGGLNTIVTVMLSEECKPVGFIGLHDRFGTSAGSYEELLEYYHLTANDIADKVREIYGKAKK